MNELPKPECERGYPWSQIDEMFDGDTVARLEKWMRGQTMMFCGGRRYNHETQSYEESCGGVSHGGVVYSWDLANFIGGGPILD